MLPGTQSVAEEYEGWEEWQQVLMTLWNLEDNKALRSFIVLSGCNDNVGGVPFGLTQSEWNYLKKWKSNVRQYEI